jgi:hypothetical protein
MPIYEITTDGEEAKRLVKAVSNEAAIAHCARQKFTAKLVTKIEDAAPLFDAGVKLETAGAAPPAAKVEGGDKPE